MLTSTHTQTLADHFRQSGRFYFAIINPNGNFVFVNPLFQQQYSHIAANFCGQHAGIFFEATGNDSFKKILSECFRNPGVTRELDVPVTAAGGQQVLSRWELSACPNEEGVIENIQAIGFTLDSPLHVASVAGGGVGELAERYNAYEQSAEGLWMFETPEPISATSAPVEIIAFWRTQAYLAECNDNTARMYGFSKAEELIGVALNQLMDFDEPAWIEYLESFIKNGFKAARVETKEFDRYGNTRYFLNSMEAVVENGMLKRVWGTQQDITEQRKTDAQLRFQSDIYAAISDAISSSDLNLTITSWNKGAEEIYGISASEIIGQKVMDHLVVSYHNTTREEVIKAVFGKGAWKGETSFTRKTDGVKKTILSAITLQRDDSGKPIGIIGVNKDITERKKAEDQLRRQAAILSNVSDLIMTMDFNYHILSWNKKAEEVMGYSEAEVKGKAWDEIVKPVYTNSSQEQFFIELNEKRFWQGEVSLQNKQGIKKHILYTVSYLSDEAGQRVAIIGTAKDITERKKAEEQLQESELFYRSLFANSLDGILLTDEQGVIVFASPSITPILGYSTEEVVGKSTFDFTYPEDRDFAVAAFMDELAENPKHKFISSRLLKKSGEWVWCIIRGHNQIQHPYINGMVVYFYDDSLRKETETALIESEQRLRSQATVLNNVTDIIVTTDPHRLVTSWNKITEKITGISEDDAIGKRIKDLLDHLDFTPFSTEQVIAIIFKEGIWRGEASFTGRSGEKVYVLMTGSLLCDEEGRHIGLLGVGKDITERKKAEARLQESEQFYRSMSFYSFDGVVMADATGKITYCGPSVEKISGYEPAQLLGRNFLEFVHPDDLHAAIDAFAKEINQQSEINYIYLRLRHARKGWTWSTVRGHNLLDTPGFHSIVIYFTDDSKRKEAEDQLRKSEENFRNLIYNLKQGVILQDNKGLMTVCNQAALDMLGLTEDHLLGKASFDPSWNVIREDGSNFPAEDHPVPMVLKLKKPVRDTVMGVYRPNTKDRVWLLVNAEPVFGSDNEIMNVVCSFADITEQKRLSKQLIEQELQKQRLLIQATIDGQEKERLEIGKELHDNINQHLTTTRLYMEVAKEKATGEVLEMITLSHKTLADIINEIRHLSQSLVPPTLGDIGLIESMHDLCDSLKRAHTFNIDFFSRHFSEEELPGNLKLMLFRITQEQVNNIVRHAKAGSIQIRLQSDAEYIILTIADDGIGFDPTHYKKGLGFSNITNRAGLFNGKVEIEAAPGKGCVLSAIIPLEGNLEGMN